MPSLGDSAVIIFLGLLLFGPKGLAQIARQLGKLMGEFRRASNEFRMQMEEELRLAEQADRQKEIAKIEAAAPPSPALPGYADNCPEDHPHLRALPADTILDPAREAAAEAVPEVAPVPIATSGELSIMPPATGLPMPRSPSARSSSLGPLIDSVPHAEASNGHMEAVDDSAQHKPMRYTSHEDGHATAPAEVVDAAAEESVHG